MDQESKSIIKWVASIFVVLIALIILFGSFTIISPGEQGIVLRVGSINRVIENGIHFKAPIIEKVVKINTQVQKEEVQATAASKDLQDVFTQVALNYSVDKTKVVPLYTDIGTTFKEKVIDPAIQEAVKAATAKYTAEELVTKREQAKNDIKVVLTDRLTPDFIRVNEVSITDFKFSKSFNEAIEAKVTAEQNALAAKNKLEQVKFEAEQKVASAEAEARSIRLQSDAANNEKYIALKQLEVQLEFAKRWKGDVPQNMYGSSPIPFVSIPAVTK